MYLSSLSFLQLNCVLVDIQQQRKKRKSVNKPQNKIIYEIDRLSINLEYKNNEKYITPNELYDKKT